MSSRGKITGHIPLTIVVIGTLPAGDGTRNEMADIRANSVLPARRQQISLNTPDGQTLIGELATPVNDVIAATLVCVHPLPTHGGMMDSHLLRKMSWRLPALANYAVLRFNLRGTASSAGASSGTFDEGVAEGNDLAAALEFVSSREDLPKPWLVGWSFGTDVILKHPGAGQFAGVILLSPPLRFTTDAELRQWSEPGSAPMKVLVPEFDDYLPPDQARARFAQVPHADLEVGVGAKHLWVGEGSVQFVLNEIVRAVTPQYFAQHPTGLPTVWDGPIEGWTDL